MTVNEIISYIRGLLKEHDVDTSTFRDRFLWETFSIASADVLANRRLRRFNYKNPQNYVGFCMELEQGLSHECGCITYGCPVLVTKNSLPKYFSGRNTPSLKIYTIGNLEIEIVDENEFEEVYRYSDIYKDKVLASIVNNKIVIWNTLELKVIRVRALWEDITEIDSVQYCSDNDSTLPNCVDVYNMNIGVDKDLIYTITMQNIIPMLNIPKTLPEDITADSNSEIKQ